MIYNPYDWYWQVKGGKIWSSKEAKYVASTPENAAVTNINSEAELSEVLAVYGLKGPVPLVPASVPMWAVRTVLQSDGLVDQADALIKASEDAALNNIWDYGNYADRDSFYISALCN